MIPKKQRLSDEELKKLIEIYNNAKSNGTNVKILIRINCVTAWGKGWEWSTIEDILMVSKDVIDDAIGKYTLFGIQGLTENHYFGGQINPLGEKVNYDSLKGRQRETYNFQKVSAIFADYGYTTIKLSDDWMGADFIAISFDGNIYLKVQLKGRLSFYKKYIGKKIRICFHDSESDKWFLYPHDELLKEIEPKLKGTVSWDSNGGYSFSRLSNKNKSILEKYRIS